MCVYIHVLTASANNSEVIYTILKMCLCVCERESVYARAKKNAHGCRKRVYMIIYKLTPPLIIQGGEDS